MSKRKCAYCKEYFDKEDMIESGLSAYCSQEHRIKSVDTGRKRLAARRAAKKVEMDVPEETRELVLELDNYRCRYCGKASNNLVPHHIAYRSEARHEPWLNDPVNLITLCNYPCHLDIVHGNKNLYQPLCRQIVWLRAVHGNRNTTIRMLERELKLNEGSVQKKK